MHIPLARLDFTQAAFRLGITTTEFNKKYQAGLFDSFVQFDPETHKRFVYFHDIHSLKAILEKVQPSDVKIIHVASAAKAAPKGLVPEGYIKAKDAAATLGIRWEMMKARLKSGMIPGVGIKVFRARNIVTGQLQKAYFIKERDMDKIAYWAKDHANGQHHSSTVHQPNAMKKEVVPMTQDPNKPIAPDGWLTLKDVAEDIGVSYNTILSSLIHESLPEQVRTQFHPKLYYRMSKTGLRKSYHLHQSELEALRKAVHDHIRMFKEDRDKGATFKGKAAMLARRVEAPAQEAPAQGVVVTAGPAQGDLRCDIGIELIKAGFADAGIYLITQPQTKGS